jgi:hypothetical protein
MHDAMLNRNELERFKVLWRITSSPRSCRGGRQGCRRSDGDTMVDGIGGLVEKMRSMPTIQSTPDQFLWRGSRGRLGGAPGLPIGARGDRKWRGLAEARARVSVVPAEMSEREGGGEALGFSGGGRSSYRHQGRRHSSGPSGLQRWIGCLSELHRAASISRRKTMTKGVCGPVASGPWWLGCNGPGRPGELSLIYFFCKVFFLIFCFVFLIWVSIYFAEFPI